MAKLTVRGIEALRPRESGYKVPVGHGLALRVGTDGTKTWLVRYRVHGKQIQLRLPRTYGSNGDGAHMSLAQATAENARIQALARDGVDFAVQREAAERARVAALREEATASTPFCKLFESWLENGVSRKDGNAELRRTFSKDVIPLLGDVPVGLLSDSHLLQVLREVGRIRGRARTAERMLSEMRQMFRWAIRRNPWRALLTQGNPAELVELKQVVPHGYSAVIRDRTLSASEIRELKDIFANMADSYENAQDKRQAERPLQAETQLALWICLATGCRIGELLKTRWEHLNLEKSTWFVPREHTKTNVDWYVYLSGFALQNFESLHRLTGNTSWCFPARFSKGHVVVKSVSKQVGDRQMRFKNRRLLAHRKNDDSLVLAGGEKGEWTPHDLRRTAATMMQALRVHPDVIDRCQNHVLPGSRIRRHYLHHDYAEEKRDAWSLLGERIEAILRADNVVSLVRVA